MTPRGRKDTTIAVGHVVVDPTNEQLQTWTGRSKPNPAERRVVVIVTRVDASGESIRFNMAKRTVLRDYGEPPFLIVADMGALKRRVADPVAHLIGQYATVMIPLSYSVF